ncbi:MULTISPECIES: DUF6702 family protein [Kordiimonas]|jgi:hypothetical protein|uniref:Uncharacterized protein n=1 Tax=Kordiimonas lacus TaxID=637679 RepID=A0A1G7C6A8_9PROT|nr:MULTISPECIES: DUF6702 family protein [Kordiimonas]SDE34851.1 hypothetical protein SAMN04488071_2674 [Kordiimonas lacus]
MIKTLRTYAVHLTFLALATTGAWAHNAFATLTEIEWNQSDQSLEVIMQIHAELLEARVSIDHGSRLSFLNPEHFDLLESGTAPLMADHLRIVVNGDPVDLTFLGLEYRDQEVFVYLESDLPEAPERMEVMNSLLIDRLPGQVNSVIALVKGQRIAGDIASSGEPLEFEFP